MLLQREHIDSATRLGPEGISFALNNNGYIGDKVTTSAYQGMTEDGSFVYFCHYMNTDSGEVETCTIYVYYNKQGKLVADY